MPQRATAVAVDIVGRIVDTKSADFPPTPCVEMNSAVSGLKYSIWMVSYICFEMY